MALFDNVKPITLLAGAAVSQARFVKIDNTGRAIQSAAEADDTKGVSITAAAAAGEALEVVCQPGCRVRVEAGAAITIGDAVESDASGRAITHGGATARRLGNALEAASAAGQFITVLFAPGAGV